MLGNSQRIVWRIWILMLGCRGLIFPVFVTHQIPQFILDDAIQKGKGSACNIVVTQVQLIKIFIINNAINQSFTLNFFFYRKESSKSFTNSDTNNYLSLPFHANYLYPLYYFNLLICEAQEQVMWGFEVQFLWY